MFALIKDIVPIAAEAFVDYRMEGMFLTRLEVEALQDKRKVGRLLFAAWCAARCTGPTDRVAMPSLSPPPRRS